METAHRSRKTDGRRPLQQSLISRCHKTLHAISQRRPRSCAVCSQIVHAFKAEFEELRVYLGTVPELLSSPCITHRALLLYHLDYMQRHFSGRNRYPPEHFDLVYLIKRKGNLVMLSHTSLPRPCGPSLALVKNPPISGTYLRGKILDSQWIDVGLVRRWISSCDTHGKCCHTSLAIPNAPSDRPILLINTWRMCLTYPSPNDQYIALSYVWGKMTCLKTVKANLQQLLLDKALSSSSKFSKYIPKTVKDAMNFIGLIHERDTFGLIAFALCKMIKGHFSGN